MNRVYVRSRLDTFILRWLCRCVRLYVDEVVMRKRLVVVQDSAADLEREANK